jgi:flagellin-like protein
MRSLRKQRKAVSPILSVLLMIMVAVAAALVTYAWVMGYLGSTTSKVGKAIQIQSIAKNGTNLEVYVQNVGDGVVTLKTLFIEGVQRAESPNHPATGELQKGDTGYYIVTDYFGSIDLPMTVHAKVTTMDGTFSESSQLFEL